MRGLVQSWFVDIAFADGSVRFVQEDIDYRLYQGDLDQLQLSAVSGQRSAVSGQRKGRSIGPLAVSD
ncbi:MAG: hypothetical protein AAGA03_10165 [Planctomycetota bacterium]